MEKESKNDKLKALRKFLKENNLTISKNHHSNMFNVDMAIKVRKLRIAVFLSDGNKDFEDSMVFAPNRYDGSPLRNFYAPFFVRESESTDFVLQKMQNCLISRMLMLQKKWQKKQNRELKQ